MYGTQSTTVSERAVCIAHEVNQPLTAILTNAETALQWLTRDPANLDEAKQAIERIIGNTLRAAGVVRGVRDLVRKSPPMAANLDINNLIKGLLNLVSLDLRLHRIAVEVELAENLEPVMGHHGQLERVVANLVANGIEAMRTVQDRQRELRISTRLDKDGDVLVAVEDTGTGLDPALVDRIFDPLFTTKCEGMGLGLWICRSIVTAHGGRLWATPNLPHGSIFRFVVPAAVGPSTVGSKTVAPGRCRQTMRTNRQLEGFVSGAACS
ncbi:sensor histidine kinase [Mesorhizobium sanjuanii]|nr:sensor histidine kinase [Mesorhizobium sanjuanii]